MPATIKTVHEGTNPRWDDATVCQWHAEGTIEDALVIAGKAIGQELRDEVERTDFEPDEAQARLNMAKRLEVGGVTLEGIIRLLSADTRASATVEYGDPSYEPVRITFSVVG